MSETLAVAAKERSARCLDAVKTAIRTLGDRRASISLKAVATEAGVSRNFIYSTPAARELVSKARAQYQATAPREIPTRRSGSSDQSLHTRLLAALARAESLASANAALRAQNEALLAEVIELQNPTTGANVVPLRQRRF